MTDLLARVSARRPWLTIGVWVVLLIVAGGLNLNLLDSATTTELRLAPGFESEDTRRVLEERFPSTQRPREVVVVQSDSLTVDDPVFAAKVNEVFAAMIGLGPEVVGQGFHYFLLPDPRLVSADRKTTVMLFEMAGTLEEAEANIEHVFEAIDGVTGADGFRVLIVGQASSSYETNEFATHDLEQGERFGVPVALLILLVLFGAVVAALVPIGLAIVGIGIALGLAALIGQVYELVFFVTLMITMIGLAVGIDYSLLMVSRFRDEMGRGLPVAEAVERTGATAGRTVLFSGVTVVIALLGLFIVPMGFFRSLGLGAVLVVIVELAATLTLLPAVLMLLGPNVNRLSLPYFGKRAAGGAQAGDDAGGGFWDVTTRIVTRFPVFGLLLVGIPMVAVTLFYFQIETGLNGVDKLPEGARTREAFLALEANPTLSFGVANPVEIVIDGDPQDPQVRSAVATLTASLASLSPAAPLLQVNPEGDLALMQVVLPGEPSSPETVDAVNVIRDELVPAAFAGVPATASVGGISSVASDVFSITDFYTPIVFAFVLGFSFIVLMLVFRSIVIPVKAVFMNLLSVGATYGILVLVFQQNVGRELLGFQHAEVIDVWIPLFLFTVLFGLSMDYHVFLLSRVRERYDQTGNNAEAVAHGLRETTAIITGAALIMVAVFGAFASGKTIVNQQVGFGLAVAILLDATLVRSVLVPASMELLGSRNWYLPSWLEWLPDVRVEPVEE
ncbi:MAG: MMPL family transporter [Chloroflexi bacterium]|nr:MMPL family transporter [Chloroflexota bacterium]